MSAPQILQFGTGRLLQALVDLVIGEALDRGEALGTVAAVQTSGSAAGRARSAALRQPGGFPVRIQGLEAGRPVDRTVRVTSVTAAFDAAEDWAAIEDLAVHHAEAIISNTADRGYELAAGDGPAGPVPRAFPAKLVRLLHARWRHRARPVTLFPCELISGNGDVLRRICDRLAGDWQLDPGFRAWLAEDCLWANSLVDRIVSQALEPIGAVAEPYALWAIQDRSGLVPPCRHPALLVTTDLQRQERLKLFILNLGHSWLAERWLVEGRPAQETVREALEDSRLAASLAALWDQEVLPVFAALGLGAEAAAYRRTTLERFRNPFLEHRLADIAQNHAAKLNRRFAPVVALAEAHCPDLAQPRLRGVLARAAG